MYIYIYNGQKCRIPCASSISTELVRAVYKLNIKATREHAFPKETFHLHFKY